MHWSHTTFIYYINLEQSYLISNIAIKKRHEINETLKQLMTLQKRHRKGFIFNKCVKQHPLNDLIASL